LRFRWRGIRSKCLHTQSKRVFFGGEIVEVFTEAEASVNDRGAVPAAD